VKVNEKITLVEKSSRAILLGKRFSVFRWCSIYNHLFFSKLYTHTKKRNSYTVVLNSELGIAYGQIDCFVYAVNSDSQHVYTLVTELCTSQTNKVHFNLPRNALDCTIVPTVVPVSFGSKRFIDVNCLMCKCLYIVVSSQSYVCVPPNSLSLD